MSQITNLYDPKVFDRLNHRINMLEQNKKPIWGEMNTAQMMAHVTAVMKNGLDVNKLPRKLIGYFIAPFWRHKYFNDKPYKIKNLVTHPNFKMADTKEFEYEKEQLHYWLKVFHEEGMQRSKDACHPLLGRFTPEQWGIGQYKHLDHHLRQFGV